jgi:hypothetical protein
MVVRVDLEVGKSELFIRVLIKVLLPVVPKSASLLEASVKIVGGPNVR